MEVNNVAYDYLQGTYAGGLFDSLNNQQQSNQAQFTQNPQYNPGQGAPPYAMDSGGNSFNDGNYSGGSGSTFSTYDPSDLYVGGKLYTGATAAHMRNQGLTGDQDPLVIGQMSPEQIARNEAIMGGSSGGMSGSATSGGSSGAGGNSGSGGTIDRTPSAGALTGAQDMRGNVNSTQPNTAGLLGNLFSGGSGTPINPQDLQSFNYPGAGNLGYQQPQGGQLGQPQGGQLQMQQMSPDQAQQGYLNTPGYQLMFGQGVQDRFQEDPGYQYAQDQAMQQVQRNAAAKGLLGSGRVIRDMQDRSMNMANQQYGNWFNRQNQAFNQYQNRLAGLAGGPTGAEQANQMGTNLGQAGLQTGANLGSLFGGMGTAGMSGIVNTGAAQAGNINQAGGQAAQMQAANQATKLAGASLGGLF